MLMKYTPFSHSITTFHYVYVSVLFSRASPTKFFFLLTVIASSESRKDGKLSTPEIGDKPHQPSNFRFPQREFGKTSVVKRSFQHNWFQRWPWLHYYEEQDLAFCFTCIFAYKNWLLILKGCYCQIF